MCAWFLPLIVHQGLLHSAYYLFVFHFLFHPKLLPGMCGADGKIFFLCNLSHNILKKKLSKD